MKSLIFLSLSFVSFAASAADLGGLYSLSCSYTSADGKIKKSVKSVDTKVSYVNDEEGYVVGMTLSVSTVVNAVKKIESAEVTSMAVDNYPEMLIEAKTSSGRKIKIQVNVETQAASMKVNGQIQEHMKKLTCDSILAG